VNFMVIRVCIFAIWIQVKKLKYDNYIVHIIRSNDGIRIQSIIDQQ